MDQSRKQRAEDGQHLLRQLEALLAATGPGHQLERTPPHFERQRLPGYAQFGQAVLHLECKRLQNAFHLVPVTDIALQRHLFAHRFALAHRFHQPVILPTGIAIELSSILAEQVAQMLFTHMFQISSVLDTQLSEFCCRHLAHPEELLDGQDFEESRCLFREDDGQPIGLVRIGGDLGQKLAVRDPGRGSKVRLVPDLSLDFLRESGGFLQGVNGVSHVEVGFVQAKRFDEWRPLAENRHDLVRDGTVHVEASGQEDRCGAEALRCAAGHGRMHAVSTGLVGGGGYNATPVRRPTHDDGLASIFGVVPLLDAGVEGVQVDVQNESVLHYTHFRIVEADLVAAIVPKLPCQYQLVSHGAVDGKVLRNVQLPVGLIGEEA